MFLTMLQDYYQCGAILQWFKIIKAGCRFELKRSHFRHRLFKNSCCHRKMLTWSTSFSMTTSEQGWDGLSDSDGQTVGCSQRTVSKNSDYKLVFHHSKETL